MLKFCEKFIFELHSVISLFKAMEMFDWVFFIEILMMWEQLLVDHRFDWVFFIEVPMMCEQLLVDHLCPKFEGVILQFVFRDFFTLKDVYPYIVTTRTIFLRKFT